MRARDQVGEIPLWVGFRSDWIRLRTRREKISYKAVQLQLLQGAKPQSRKRTNAPHSAVLSRV